MSKKKHYAKFLIIIGMILAVVLLTYFFPKADKTHNRSENYCDFGNTFSCIDYYVQKSTGTVSVMLRNEFNNQIKIELIEIDNSIFKKIECKNFPKFGNMKPDEIKEFKWSGCDFKGLIVGEKGNIKLLYKMEGNDKKLKAEVNTIIQ